MNWYIVQAYSGFENKVVDLIKEELKKQKLPYIKLNGSHNYRLSTAIAYIDNLIESKN